jgi:hypothetical protein
MEELTDEVFYGTVAKHLEELHSFPISFEEKRQLYYSMYEGMMRHEELKISAKQTEEGFRRFGESLCYLERAIYTIRDSVGKLNENGKIALLNAQIANEKMKEAVKMIKKTKQNVIETTKGLQVKLAQKDALLSITLGMTSQGKPKQ